MNSGIPPVIHDVLPTEITGVIFEEHAKLEWVAPAIDGRVCRRWRQIVLNAPRAWAYLEICARKRPRIGELHLWLRRSGKAPLHVRVDENFTPNQGINKRTLYDILGHYHTRITSLRMQQGDPSFFERREFPRLRLLDIGNWYLVHLTLSTTRWGSMPELRSLHLGPTEWSVVPLNCLTPLKTPVLWGSNYTSLSRHSHSLTTLMLDRVSVRDVTLGPVAYPSLTYLSLNNVIGLKRHINAPRLVTYHQGGNMGGESFSAPLPSLVEYGVYDPNSGDSDPLELHRSFPNISRLSIRANPPVLISFLSSLSSHLHSLPALEMISLGSVKPEGEKIPEADKKTMTSLVRVRSEACHTNVALCFETGPPFNIPLFFGHVSRHRVR
jgi:hypothetical protein